MPLSELLVYPMRQDLIRLGFEEARTAEEVKKALERPGTILVAVNSACGCSGASLRPALALALGSSPRPHHLVTVFAGQDVEATAKAREYFVGYPPSSPSVALLRNGTVVFMLERHRIKDRTPEEVAADLRAALHAHCTPPEPL